MKCGCNRNDTLFAPEGRRRPPKERPRYLSTKITVLPIAIVGVLLCMPAQAAVITFDAHLNDFGTPIVDSGFQFDFTASGWGVFGPGSGACCTINYNGTPALFADGDRSGPATVIMTKSGGGTFNVSGLDASVYWTGASGHINLIGALSGGGTVTTTLSVGSTWASFALGSFNNLVSLTFQDSVSGAFLVAPGFGIDNINTSPGSATPEPGSFALMAVGLVLLGKFARQVKQNG